MVSLPAVEVALELLSLVILDLLWARLQAYGGKYSVALELAVLNLWPV